MVSFKLIWPEIDTHFKKRYIFSQRTDLNDEYARVLETYDGLQEHLKKVSGKAVIFINQDPHTTAITFRIDVLDPFDTVRITDEVSINAPIDANGALKMTDFRPMLKSVTNRLDDYLQVRRDPRQQRAQQQFSELYTYPCELPEPQTQQARRNPFEVGRADRLPVGGSTVIQQPSPSFGPSGNLVGRDHALFNARGQAARILDPDAPNPLGLEPPGPHMFGRGLPNGERPLPRGAVPTGARFDPFGPV
ncbi:hypothetical protein J8273_4467 [Carpediemonas membranifera]|uniref:Proteasome inhibitor PI31 subunit n=1 Tax=Carpediemonas membranifera TaxID=201153 RepID=A0A8J6DZT8_9EUKA|nr:hypothetical protein J8273_4467 [Carpediemonas membranifera]|eukprot:KAG9394104.1 hypothetical protein J8273_4467 [Carpediemonas membranifera]